MSARAKLSFHDRFAVGIEHATRDRNDHGTWTCTCEECHKLQLYFDKKRAREKARRRHIELLIQIMSYRHHPYSWTPKKLEEAQLEFEKIMIRKLKLDHLEAAAFYGFKVRKAAA
jgi:hypothetical protein